VKAERISRRSAIAATAAFAVWRPVAAAAQACPEPNPPDGPRFSATGPDANRYGAAEDFPIGDPALHGRPGEPRDVKYLVGTYSHFNEIFPVNHVARAATPWCFSYARTDLAYTYKGQKNSLEDYLSRNPVTGLMAVKDDTILFEHYQYGRTDTDKIFSGSMVKSIVGLLVGVAVSNGLIGSVDDLPEHYVPELRGTEYGRTPIRDLLHMASGVAFGEAAHNDRDLDRLWIDMVQGRGIFPLGTIGSITQFNNRIAAPGTKWFYASIEPDVLGVVLRAVTGKSLSDYLHQTIWDPIGTEADAAWLVDAQGHEVAHTYFGAVLRDYARLGRLLAHDGAWNGRQVIPAAWLREATTTRTADGFLARGRNGPGSFGYGYLLWLLPGPNRRFALIGSRGQRVCVDPVSRLVLVQTAVDESPEFWSLWSALVNTFGAASVAPTR
jgi:CubicO group peptidase (beta-lactamase class C family)